MQDHPGSRESCLDVSNILSVCALVGRDITDLSHSLTRSSMDLLMIGALHEIKSPW